MIPVVDGYEITEQEDGKFRLTVPNCDKPELYDTYSEALIKYIESHNQVKALDSIDLFFEHYDATPVPLRMRLDELVCFTFCALRGLSSTYFIADDYRCYIKSKCRKLYAQLENYRQTPEGKELSFEISEMKEILMRIFDIFSNYEHEFHNWLIDYAPRPREDGEINEEE